MKTHKKYGTPVYTVWAAMLSRCKNRSQDSYKYYGGKGIKVCERWHSFENFFSDMGEKPKNKSLDRINSMMGYGPDNCRWATDMEQANNKTNNRRISAFGKNFTLAEWSRVTGIKSTTITQRIDEYGWDTERALLIKKRGRKKSGRLPVLSGAIIFEAAKEYSEAKLGIKHAA